MTKEQEEQEELCEDCLMMEKEIERLRDALDSIRFDAQNALKG